MRPLPANRVFPTSPASRPRARGARGSCLHLLTIPPGGRARAHRHDHHETAIYIISGEVEVWHGDALDERFVAGPGDFISIPAGAPHLPINRSATEPCACLIARTDPNEQESVVLLPHLEDRVGSS